MKKEDYPFKPGDMVRSNYDFVDERRIYQLPYPRLGQYLTVAECFQDQIDENIFMLCFEDLRLPIPLSSERFDVVQTEREGDTVLSEAYKIANKL